MIDVKLIKKAKNWKNGSSALASGNASYGGVDLSNIYALLGLKLDKAVFDDLFEKVNIGTDEDPKYAIRAKYGLYSNDFISVLGASDDNHWNDPIGKSYLGDLLDVTLSGLTVGQMLVWDGSKWVNRDFTAGSVTSIYELNLEAGQFQPGTYNPASSVATFRIPTLTSHLTNDSDFVTSLVMQEGLSGKMDKAVFDELFEKVNIGSEGNARWAIRAKLGLYSNEFISVFGNSDGLSHGYGTSLLSELEDVSLSGLSEGQSLVWDGSKWVNRAVSGEVDLSGYVKKSGDTMTGDLTVPGIRISSAGSEAYFSSDSNTNAFIHLGGKYMMVWDAYFNCIRPGSQFNEAFSIGQEGARWSNICSVTGNFSGLITTGGGIVPSSNNVVRSGSSTLNWQAVHSRQLVNNTATEMWIWQAQNYRIAFATNGIGRMSIYEDGNVGIGTQSSYGFKLDVAGDVRGFTFFVSGSSNSTSYISSDTTTNLFISVNNKTGLVLDGSSNQVRPGSLYNNVFTLGSSTIRWNNVYSYNGNFASYISLSGHLYLMGVDATSSTQNTSQIVFGTGSDNHVCITSNMDAVIINPTTSTTTGQLYLGVNGKASYFTSAGNFGIGSNAPSYKLHVAGVIYSSTGVLSSGYVTCTSDERLKNIINTVKLSVAQIAEAPAVLFSWKKNGRMDVGSIAQYWQRLLPQTVVEDAQKYLSMDYGKAALISAIITARKVVDHETRIKRLEKENRRLKQRIKELEDAD